MGNRKVEGVHPLRRRINREQEENDEIVDNDNPFNYVKMREIV